MRSVLGKTFFVDTIGIGLSAGDSRTRGCDSGAGVIKFLLADSNVNGNSSLCIRVCGKQRPNETNTRGRNLRKRIRGKQSVFGQHIAWDVNDIFTSCGYCHQVNSNRIHLTQCQWCLTMACQVCDPPSGVCHMCGWATNMDTFIRASRCVCPNVLPTVLSLDELVPSDSCVVEAGGVDSADTNGVEGNNRAIPCASWPSHIPEESILHTSEGPSLFPMIMSDWLKPSDWKATAVAVAEVDGSKRLCEV